jgi:hypothetical protein
MRAVLAALLIGCAPPATTMTAEHPANPDAARGRLAGPPAALRPGVADLPRPAPPARGEVKPVPDKPDKPQKPPPAHQGHQGHH